MDEQKTPAAAASSVQGDEPAAAPQGEFIRRVRQRMNVELIPLEQVAAVAHNAENQHSLVQDEAAEADPVPLAETPAGPGGQEPPPANGREPWSPPSPNYSESDQESEEEPREFKQGTAFNPLPKHDHERVATYYCDCKGCRMELHVIDHARRRGVCAICKRYECSLCKGCRKHDSHTRGCENIHLAYPCAYAGCADGAKYSCSWCGNGPSPKLYCSQEHLQFDWEAGHRNHCR